MIEGIYRKGNKKYARINDKGIVKFIKIESKGLFFEEDPNGSYSMITDDRIKLKKTEMTMSEIRKRAEYCEMVGKNYTYLTPEFMFMHYYWLEQQVPESNIWYLDIEAIDTENRSFPDVNNPVIPITHIQILDKKMNKVFMLMTKDISDEEKQKIEQEVGRSIQWFVLDEKKMLKLFAKLIKKRNPAIITGWNAEIFDFPYIAKRAEFLGLNPNMFSPLESISYKEIPLYNKTALTTKWEGTYLNDTLESFKKFVYSDFKSYSLEYITKALLNEGDGKVNYKQYKSIHNFFKQAYDEFVKYAVKDVDVLDKIDEQIGITNLIITLATMMGCNFEDVLGTVRPWSMFLSHLALKERLVLPVKNENTDTRPITGGYVKNPQLGLKGFLFSVDFNSLYPSLQNSFNLSPDVYVLPELLDQEGREILAIVNEDEEVLLKNPELFDRIEAYCKKHNYSFGGLGFFKRDKEGILARAVGDIYWGRKKEKTKMLTYDILTDLVKDGVGDIEDIIQKVEAGEITPKNVYDIEIPKGNKDEVQRLKSLVVLKNSMQMALKILINSEFGFLDNKYSPVNNRNISGSITFLGRLINRYTGDRLSDRLNEIFKTNDVDYVIYQDTDSSYITFEKLGNKLLEKYGVKSFFDLDLEKRKEFTEKLLNFIEKEMQPIIDESVNYIQSKLNAYQKGFVGAKVEKVNLKGFWTAKKRYALLTIWNEGKFLIEKPKISVTGLEVVKSSTPDFSIEALEKAIEIILKGTEKELQDYIKEVKKEFLKVAEENPQAIGEVTKINNLDYELDDKGYHRINENGQRIGAPMNSKAGIAYNQLLKEKGLEEYYMPIEPGMKAYLIKLKPSNPYKFDAIAFLDDEFLKDTDLIKYIDTDYMWEKTFISPLKFIAESINYQLERKASTVDDWF